MPSDLKKIICSGCCCLLVLGCTNLFYYPDNYHYINENALEYPPIPIDLKISEQQETLSWYFESKKIIRKPITILFAHGNAQNMSAHFRSLYWILDKGYNYFIVGYPGFGPSDGNPSPDSTVESVKSALSWIRSNRPNDKIFVYGQSLGGNVALRAISELNDISVCGVAIEGSFLSYQKVASEVLSRNFLLWLFQWVPYLAVNESRSISTNLRYLPESRYLVVHGTSDPSISLNLGKELFLSLPEPKQFWEVEGGRHIDTFAKFPDMRNQFMKFIDEGCR